MIYDINKERMKREKAAPKISKKAEIKSSETVPPINRKRQQVLHLRDELESLRSITASQVEVLGLTDSISVSPSVYNEWAATLETERLSQIVERARGLTKEDISSKPSYCKAIANTLMKKSENIKVQVMQILDLEKGNLPEAEKDDDSAFDYESLYEYLINVGEGQEFDLFDRLFPEIKDKVPHEPGDLPSIYDERMGEFMTRFPVLTLQAKMSAEDSHFKKNPNFLREVFVLPPNSGEIYPMGLAIAVVKQNRKKNDKLPDNYNYEDWYPLFEKYCNRTNQEKFFKIINSNNYRRRTKAEKDLHEAISVFDQWVEDGITAAILNKISKIGQTDEGLESVERLLAMFPKECVLAVTSKMQEGALRAINEAGPDAIKKVLTEASKKRAKKTTKKRNAKKVSKRKSKTSSK